MDYFLDVAGTGYEGRAEVIRKHLDRDDYDNIEVMLKRHGGNKHDRYAVGIYISEPGFWGFKEQMIGFVERDLAKEISPMLKFGGSVIVAKIKRVWLPDYSNKARPHVNICITTSWSKQDVIREQNRIKSIEKEKRLARQEQKKPLKSSAQAQKQNWFKRILKALFW